MGNLAAIEGRHGRMSLDAAVTQPLDRIDTAQGTAFIDWKSFGETAPHAQMQPTVPLDAVSVEPASGGRVSALCSPEAIGAGSIRLDMKTCPVCRTQLFADMDTCYNCMYIFGSTPTLEKRLADEVKKSKRARIGGKEPPAIQAAPKTVSGIYPLQEAEGVVDAGVSGEEHIAGSAETHNAEDGIDAGNGPYNLEQKLLALAPDLTRETPGEAHSIFETPHLAQCEVSDAYGRKPYACGIYAEALEEGAEPDTPARCGYEAGVEESTDSLFREFLIEFEGFLRKFLVDGNIGVK